MRPKSLVWLFIAFFTLGLLLAGCGTDDDDDSNSPLEPSNPLPEDGATDQENVLTLSWSCSDPDEESLVYNVYFGDINPPPLDSMEHTDTTYQTDTLELGTTYYWQIIATDGFDPETPGPVWSFTTLGNHPPGLPANPNPADSATDVPLHVTLSWTCIEIDGDTLTYDLFFGTNTLPPLLAQDLPDSNSAQSYELDILEFETTYYWKVTARDSRGGETEGVLWTFTTLPEDTTIQNVPPSNPVHGDEWIAYLSGDSVELVMIWIAPGAFEMGSDPSDTSASDDEFPQHAVTLVEGYWMAKYETTQEQWQEVTGENPSFFTEYPNRPVESVEISASGVFDILEFLEVMNAGETNSPWRLPSEAEWEYACRAGTDTRFIWGDDPDSTELTDNTWFAGNSGQETHDVGQKLPNAWGLYDMLGNVLEICEDDWHDDYTGAPSDGSAWVDVPRGEQRVARGSSIEDESPEAFRSACRTATSEAASNRGFRLVRSPD